MFSRKIKFKLVSQGPLAEWDSFSKLADFLLGPGGLENSRVATA